MLRKQPALYQRSSPFNQVSRSLHSLSTTYSDLDCGKLRKFQNNETNCLNIVTLYLLYYLAVLLLPAYRSTFTKGLFNSEFPAHFGFHISLKICHGLNEERKMKLNKIKVARRKFIQRLIRTFCIVFYA